MLNFEAVCDHFNQDSEEAKDLFQETLYRAIANKDKYNVGTNIKAWLYTIMRNIFIIITAAARNKKRFLMRPRMTTF
jgi:DNA-directed RNA polymerase specialized sigma24 family protein